MSLDVSCAARTARGICALLGLMALAGCEGALGTSPPHAAPAFPRAEGLDGQVELTWGAVTDADSYVILWDDGTVPNVSFNNEIRDIEVTSFSHTGLTNLRTYRYRIVAETSGGRGPESITATAVPGPLPGGIEWTVVTSQAPGRTVHFSPATLATSYRVYAGATESSLLPRRPLALFEETDDTPLVNTGTGLTTPILYRVFAMNDGRIGPGGPIVASPTHVVTTYDLPRTAVTFGDPNDDDCLDLPTGTGAKTGTACIGVFVVRVLADAGLADLFAPTRANGDSRFFDFTGDLRDDLFSNTLSLASDTASIALLHVNQGTGNYQTAAGVSALDIGGFGGTLLAADFDNDGDIDLFAPNDHTRGDGARNWLLRNNGGVFTDIAVAAGVDSNPPGAAYVPRGGQAVDFNEDGFVDLLFGSRLLINDGDGTFSDGSTAAGIPVLADQGLKLVDIDIDGDLDLLHHDGSVTRLHHNTAGVFGAGTIVNQDAVVPSFGLGLNACDINNDGFEDMIVAHNVTATGTGVPRLYVNVAGTLMPSAVQREVVANSNDLVAHNDLIGCGDIDGSTMQDIVVRWGTNYRVLRAAQPLSRRIRIRVLGAGGERNQQGRIVRVAPRDSPTRIMTRVIDSGSGLHSQNMYDLIIGAPWIGIYDITVRFGAGVVTTTAEPGDDLTIFSDGRIEDGLE